MQDETNKGNKNQNNATDNTQIVNVPVHKGNDRMLLGMVFTIITFWLFAQSLLNVAPDIQRDINIPLPSLSLAISLTALFSGCFMVVAGGLADRFGRLKFTYIGLILSIVGCICLMAADGIALFAAGRIIQGLSAACVMPATLALIKAYYEGADRQRALSFWSIGSFGGSGFCSIVGGLIATNYGWRWIFIMSIIIALIAGALLKGTPESKSEENKTGSKFDYSGLVVFVVGLVALNLFITQGKALGWTSMTTLILLAVSVVSIIIFFKIEIGKRTTAFIDFSLFNNKPYSGAVLSNFLVNSVAGTILVANTYNQMGRGLDSSEAGRLTIGYLIAVLLMIRVGELILRKFGAKKPMIMGPLFTGSGIALMSLTFLPNASYFTVVTIGFVLLGLGLGFYATPSTDTAVSNAPDDKVGVASGIFKMSSTLGNAFGLAISSTIFFAMMGADKESIDTAAAFVLLLNVGVCILAAISVFIMVPNNTGRIRKP